MNRFSKYNQKYPKVTSNSETLRNTKLYLASWGSIHLWAFPAD